MQQAATASWALLDIAYGNAHLLHFKNNLYVPAIALKVNNSNKAELVPGIQTAPDGIYKLVKKKAKGYGYIKEVN